MSSSAFASISRGREPRHQVRADADRSAIWRRVRGLERRGDPADHDAALGERLVAAGAVLGELLAAALRCPRAASTVGTAGPPKRCCT